MAFSNSILAGDVLVRTAIESENFVSGSNGWRIERDGTAEFQELEARGNLTATELDIDNRNLDDVSLTNLIPAQSAEFEGAGTGNFDAWFGCTIAKSTAQANEGTGSLEITATATDIGINIDNFPGWSGFTENTNLVLFAHLWKANPVRTVTIGYLWKNEAGTTLRTDELDISAGGSEWATNSMVVTTPAGTTRLFVWVQWTGAEGDVVYLDTLTAGEPIGDRGRLRIYSHVNPPTEFETRIDINIGQQNIDDSVSSGPATESEPAQIIVGVDPTEETPRLRLKSPRFDNQDQAFLDVVGMSVPTSPDFLPAHVAIHGGNGISGAFIRCAGMAQFTGIDTTNESITNTAFAHNTHDVSRTFTAPPSGELRVDLQTRITMSITGNVMRQIVLGWELIDGFPGGPIVPGYGANSDRAIITSIDGDGASTFEADESKCGFWLIEGLDPGTVYTIRTMSRASHSAITGATIRYRQMAVTPSM